MPGQMGRYNNRTDFAFLIEDMSFSFNVDSYIIWKEKAIY